MLSTTPGRIRVRLGSLLQRITSGMSSWLAGRTRTLMFSSCRNATISIGIYAFLTFHVLNSTPGGAMLRASRRVCVYPQREFTCSHAWQEGASCSPKMSVCHLSRWYGLENVVLREHTSQQETSASHEDSSSSSARSRFASASRASPLCWES